MVRESWGEATLSHLMMCDDCLKNDNKNNEKISLWKKIQNTSQTKLNCLFTLYNSLSLSAYENNDKQFCGVKLQAILEEKQEQFSSKTRSNFGGACQTRSIFFA